MTTNPLKTPIRSRSFRVLMPVLLGFALVAAACGTGEEPAQVQSAAGQTTIESQILPAADPSGGATVSDGSDASAGQVATAVADAQTAVIQIQATGGWVEPDTGPIEGIGRGSGFFISDDGLAVTNHHVVGGAAILEVFVNGDTDPVRARILGVDECSDLAVIKVDGGSYPYLQFVDSDTSVGTQVYSAGFPLGDPEYTLTAGILSKEDAQGDTVWASVDAVVEHDARINRGNSGGPLLNENGQVVGVNYAGNIETDQNFAITGNRALPIINRMAQGENVDSIGIQGTVMALGEVAGMWVSSVETGSPADQAGVMAGDFITKVENIDVGAEGDKRRYCEAVRGQGSTNEIAMELIRPSTGEVLKGNINSFEGLVPSFSPEAGASLTTQGAGTTYTDFTTITDDTGRLSVQVPTGWNQTRTVPYSVSGVSLPLLIATTNLEAVWKNGDFNEDPNAPLASGVAMFGADAAGTDVTPGSLLADMASTAEGQCQSVSDAESFEVGTFIGLSQTGTGCGDTGDASGIWLAAQDPETGKIVVAIVQMLTEADVQQLPTILTSLRFV